MKIHLKRFFAFIFDQILLQILFTFLFFIFFIFISFISLKTHNSQLLSALESFKNNSFMHNPKFFESIFNLFSGLETESGFDWYYLAILTSIAILSFLTEFFYYFIHLKGEKQATLGMRIFNLKLISRDDQPLTPKKIRTRELIFIAIKYPFLTILWLIAGIVAAIFFKSIYLHDLISKTRIISTQKNSSDILENT